ncbi:hypothetical protein AB0J74_35930 [Asanoa sp. NPDC049573]|uniref:hypothetical protein n=1 Tax=Asanoa sp. NPDC049573 TaxID=3155396 RepID=UPI003445C52D
MGLDKLSGQRKKRLALIASLLVVAAVAVPVIVKASDVVLPGSAIGHPDNSAVTLSVREPLVGDVVMFELDVPDIKDGRTIRVTEIAASPDRGLTLLGARIYHREDFGGFALCATGNHGVDEIEIQYESASHRYEQTLTVDFEVRDALPGNAVRVGCG